MELYEPISIPELFADHIANVTVINGIFRCTLCSLQPLPFAKTPASVGIARLIMPAGSVPLAIALSNAALRETIQHMMSS